MTEHALLERLRRVDPVCRTGQVTRIFSNHVEADGPDLPLRGLCTIETRNGGVEGSMCAEVARVDRDSIVLTPLESNGQVFAGARVTALAPGRAMPVGDELLGRAVDALGQLVDGGRGLSGAEHEPLNCADVLALDRTSPREILETGVRAIDGLLTLGKGQRIGIFAASGVGKTSLITQLAKQTSADRFVICLVGERGREVEALWNHGLSPDSRAKSVLVAATADQPAAMRVRAGEYAIALADHWRRQGLHVVLILDSMTRLAMALREVGLAAGEPPTVRAYTPSVFAAIPKLIEQCGAVRSGGAITALMTVLSETDDMDDPLSEMLKSLLDGHILLSRSLAEQGHFPAIDVPKSISRLAAHLVPSQQRSVAQEVIARLSTYESSRLLIETGVYAAGSSDEIDRAIACRPAINAFLRQAEDERISLRTSFDALGPLLKGAA